MRTYLISLRFTRGNTKRAPLVVEALIQAENMESAIEQIESMEVENFKQLNYGHSSREDFKPDRKGTEDDFEQFLKIASEFDIEVYNPINRRD